jgi:hypothetical protein
MKNTAKVTVEQECRVGPILTRHRITVEGWTNLVSGGSGCAAVARLLLAELPSNEDQAPEPEPPGSC